MEQVIRWRCFMFRGRSLISCIICAMALCANVFAYSGGSGTVSDPYQIATKADLLQLGATTADYDKNFVLTADIDLAGTTYTTAIIAPDTDPVTAEFQGMAFSGTFGGGGHSITNLTIDAGSTGNDCLGLFGYTSQTAIIASLAAENVSITVRTGSDFCGGMVGWNGGTIENCHSSGTVGGQSLVGGLVGRNRPGTVRRCYSTASVSCLSDHAGGLTGTNGDGANLVESYATGPVSGPWHIGGLVGSGGGAVTRCYATGNITGGVTGGGSMGGLIGGSGGAVLDSYSTGSVTMSAGDSVGGFVGWMGAGSVNRCYSTGRVTGSVHAGGLVGFIADGTVSGSFWDTQTSGMSTSVGGTGKTTAQMKTIGTFTAAGWDFVGESANGTNDFWQMVPGWYPLLSWQPTPSSAILHVSTTGNDAFDGRTWAKAKATLTAAVAAAVAGDEIWVAAGTYKPASDYGLAAGSGEVQARLKHFRMKGGVGIYGGFAGTELYRNQSDPKTNLTVLSGDIGLQGDQSDNCYRIFYLPFGVTLDGTAVIDGFTLTLGNGTGGGSAIYLYGSSANISRCVFSNNIGTAVTCELCTLSFTDCTFTGNVAPDYLHAGAMFVNTGHWTVTNCRFTNNSAYIGGAIDAWKASDLLVTNCIFKGNAATYGGAVNVGPEYSPVATLVGCTFQGNQGTYGSALYRYSGGTATIRNSILWDSGTELSGTPVVTYSDVKGGYSGTSNINLAPQFVNEATDLRLLPGSPCIDAGSNTYATAATDLAGNQRVMDGNGDGTRTVDMGAYEFAPFDARFVVAEKRRLGRTLYEYDCKVAIWSNLPASVNVTGFQLLGASANVSIIDSAATIFGNVAAYGEATSQDTCTLRVDRSQLINPTQVTWTITYAAATGSQSMEATAMSPLVLEPPVAGDVNGDGVVDSADLVTMGDEWLTVSASGDGVVNFVDFAAFAEGWIIER
jgi:hypothetical protein